MILTDSCSAEAVVLVLMNVYTEMDKVPSTQVFLPIWWAKCVVPQWEYPVPPRWDPGTCPACQGSLTWGGPMRCPLPTLSSFSSLVTACRQLWHSPALYPSPWKKFCAHASWIHRVNPQLLCSVTGCGGAAVHHHGLSVHMEVLLLHGSALVGWGTSLSHSAAADGLLQRELN